MPDLIADELSPAVPCSFCPRHCGIIRPKNATQNIIAGFCHSPRLPLISRAGLHFWEEPVLSGTQGAGTVFFTGCNLHCVYCQNYDISFQNNGKQVSIQRLREIYQELIKSGAHNIDLVTPTHYLEAVKTSLTPHPPVPVVWNSSGYELAEKIRELDNFVDVYLPDLKYSDSAIAEKYSHAPDYFETATRAIKEMYRQTGPYQLNKDGLITKGVIIRHLILPGKIKNSLGVINWVAENFKPGEIMFSLMRQYIPCGAVNANCYQELNRRVSDTEYNYIEKKLFESGIEDGFVQEADSAKTEFIPVFDGSGV